MKDKLYQSALCKGVIDKSKQIVHVIASTGVIDRHGDSVNPTGWRTENFMNNPVALVAHDYRSLPIGKYVKVWIEEGKLQGYVQIADTAAGKELFYLISEGYLNAVSVGFIVTKWGVAGQDEYTIMEQELLEISFVAVPANAEATISNDVEASFQTLVKSVDKSEEKEPEIEPVVVPAEEKAAEDEPVVPPVEPKKEEEPAVPPAETKTIAETIELIQKGELTDETVTVKATELVELSTKIATLENSVKLGLSPEATALMLKMRSDMVKADQTVGTFLKLVKTLLSKSSSTTKGGEN